MFKISPEHLPHSGDFGLGGTVGVEEERNDYSLTAFLSFLLQFHTNRNPRTPSPKAPLHKGVEGEKKKTSDQKITH